MLGQGIVTTGALRLMMAGPPYRRLGLDAAETQASPITLIANNIDRPDRIILGKIVFQPLGKHGALTAVIANSIDRVRYLSVLFCGRYGRWP